MRRIRSATSNGETDKVGKLPKNKGKNKFSCLCLPRYDSNVNSLTHLHANLFAYSYANMPFTNENEKPESLSDISRKGGYATHT